MPDQDIAQLIRFDNLRAIYRVCVTFNERGMKALSVAEKRILDEILELDYERGRK